MVIRLTSARRQKILYRRIQVLRQLALAAKTEFEATWTPIGGLGRMSLREFSDAQYVVFILPGHEEQEMMRPFGWAHLARAAGSPIRYTLPSVDEPVSYRTVHSPDTEFYFEDLRLAALFGAAVACVYGWASFFRERFIDPSDGLGDWTPPLFDVENPHDGFFMCSTSDWSRRNYQEAKWDGISPTTPDYNYRLFTFREISPGTEDATTASIRRFLSYCGFGLWFTPEQALLEDYTRPGAPIFYVGDNALIDPDPEHTPLDYPHAPFLVRAIFRTVFNLRVLETDVELAPLLPSPNIQWFENYGHIPISWADFVANGGY